MLLFIAANVALAEELFAAKRHKAKQRIVITAVDPSIINE